MKALYHTSCSKTIKHTCIRKLKEIITLYSLKKSSTILQRQQEHAHQISKCRHTFKCKWSYNNRLYQKKVHSASLLKKSVLR